MIDLESKADIRNLCSSIQFNSLMPGTRLHEYAFIFWNREY
jgi:hypothetical protein